MNRLLEDHYFYNLYQQYIDVNNKLSNLITKENLGDIFTALKSELATVFKQYKVRVSPKQWAYFDENMRFAHEFWQDKISINNELANAVNNCFKNAQIAIDALRDELHKQKISLRQDMWANCCSIPVELFIGDSVAPVYYWQKSNYGGHIDTKEEDAIELAQHLWSIGFKVELYRSVLNKGNNYQPPFTFILFANIKPELVGLLLACWPECDGECADTPFWYPLQPLSSLTDIAKLDMVKFDDYSLECE